MDKIICVVGPTASGKTALAVRLAKALDGEVVSCDSMQIYRRMDVGTAKPAAEEMDGVPHHMIDIADPAEDFSVGKYVELADAAVQDILARGKVCVIAGGTGLYVDSLIAGRTFAPVPSTGKRAVLEGAGCAPRAAKRCCASCTRSTPRPQRGCIRRTKSASSVRLRSGRKRAGRSRSTTARHRRSRALRARLARAGFHEPRRSLRAHRPTGRDHAGTGPAGRNPESPDLRRAGDGDELTGHRLQRVFRLSARRVHARRGDGALPAALAQLCQAAADVVPPESCDALDPSSPRSRTQTRFLRRRGRKSPFSRKKYDRVLGITDI